MIILQAKERGLEFIVPSSPLEGNSSADILTKDFQPQNCEKISLLQATQSMVYGYTLPKKLIWSY
jgi:hypothetical protein